MTRHSTNPNTDTRVPTNAGGRSRNLLAMLDGAVALACVAAALALFAPAAHASKQPVDFLGGNGTLGGQFAEASGVAVNDSGAGPANVGDIYVADAENNRIQRFGRDDAGTPAEPADDTYFFISAWGADVDSTPSGGSSYEICATAADCKPAVATGGNGSSAGNGTLSFPNFTFPDFTGAALAVDQETGDVFVADAGNHRVNVYDGTGTFLRSFGFDVVESGPDDAGSGYEICAAGSGDVCKGGLPGSGTGQISSAGHIAVSQPDGDPTSGSVFLADKGNHRVDAYDLDGSSPSTIGSAVIFDKSQDPAAVAIDSRGILYTGAEENDSEVERYDSQGVNGPVGFLAPIALGTNEVQRVTIEATAGTYKLNFDPDGAGPQPAEATTDIPFDWIGGSGRIVGQNSPVDTVAEALEALPSIRRGNVVVNGGPGDAGGSQPYEIIFRTALGAKDVPQLFTSSGSAPLSGGAGASVATITPGQPGLIDWATRGLAVVPDSDGAGPDTDVLYALRTGGIGVIQQFGPVNPPGLLIPPVAEDDRHNTNGITFVERGLATEPSTGRLYVTGSGPDGTGVYVLDDVGPPPSVSLDSIADVTTHSVVVNATIDPNGPPDTRYQFEYSPDDVSWTSLPEVILGHQEGLQPVQATIDPPAFRPQPQYHLPRATERWASLRHACGQQRGDLHHSR